MKETTLKIPTIDMEGTGANILKLREKNGHIHNAETS